MTENEDIEKILYMDVGRSGIDNENSKIAKALNELMQYRAIGTIEEFKALKEKKNFLPIATITFSKEQLQEIIDEKVAQIELDIQGIRAKAIDEFFQELQKYEEDDMWLRLKMSSIYEIAEQMKAGDNNE